MLYLYVCVYVRRHPYVIVDRVEDITPTTVIAECPTVDRDLTLYGYVRGTHLRSQQRMHLIGVGDFDLTSVSAIADPCMYSSYGGEDLSTGNSTKIVSLKKKKANLLYAPMADVGGRMKMVEGDGVYIELKNIHYTKEHNLIRMGGGEDDGITTRGGGGGANSSSDGNTPADLLRRMQDTSMSLSERIHDTEMSLFPGQIGIKSSSIVVGKSSSTSNGDEEEEEDDYDDYDNEEEDDDADVDAEENSDDEGEEGEDDDGEEGEEKENNNNDNNMQWKVGMNERAATSYSNRVTANKQHGSGTGGSRLDIMRLVYGSAWNSNANAAADDDDSSSIHSDEDEDELFRPVHSKNTGGISKYKINNLVDSNRPRSSSSSSSTSSSSSNFLFDKFRVLFVTGGDEAWKTTSTDATPPNDGSDDTDKKNGDDGGNVYGDFEDLEGGGGGDNGKDDPDSDEDDEDSIDSEAANDDIDEQLRRLHATKKSTAKEKFDVDYDNKKDEVSIV